MLSAADGVGDNEQFRERVRDLLAVHLPRFRAEAAGLGLDVDRLGLRWEAYLYGLGWGAPGWPAEHGGMGLSATEQVIFYEELAVHGAPGETNRPAKRTFAPTLMAYGTPVQQRRYLPPILAAQEVWCQGFSEPEAGSDLAGIRTTARADGDQFRVSGQKIWSSNAGMADFMFALVRTSPDGQRHRGISLVIIDMRAPGVQTRPIRKITGKDDFAEVFLDDVLIDRGDIVGPMDAGWQVAVAALTHERVINMVPRVVNLLRETADAARLAEEVGDEPLRSDAVRAQTTARVLRAACYRAVSVPPERAGLHGSYLKLAWSEAYQRFLRQMLDHCTRLLARSRLSESEWLRWHHAYLEARAATIYAGTSEIQRNIISRQHTRAAS